MAQYTADTLRRGQSGLGAFAIAEYTDLKLSDTITIDLTGRNSMEEWRRTPYMSCYVIAEDTTYRLGSDVTIAGQVWTEIEYADPNALIYDDVFDVEGFIKPELLRNLFINDSFVVDSEAEMLAMSSVTGNIFVRTDTGAVFLKLNNDDPSDISDFANITASTGAVTSVNGMTGAVSVTIANLLSNPTNLTDFNSAIASNTLIMSHSASLSSLTSNKADLVSGTVPVAQLPYVFQSGLTPLLSEVKLGGPLLYDTEIALAAFNLKINLNGIGQFGIDFGSDAAYDIIYRGSDGYLKRLAKGANGQVLKVNAGTLIYSDDLSGTSGGSVNWGNILGTITDQTDLVSYVAALSYTNEEAQDAVGGILNTTSDIAFTYDDSTPSITAAIVNGAITNAKLATATALSVKGNATNATATPTDIVGTDGQLLRVSGTSLGFGNNGLNQLLFNANQGIDVTSTGGSDVLNIGTANADVINIGYSSSTVNIQGTLVYQNVTNLQVKDKLITLNKGGATSSGSSSGFEIEENSIITGWVTTNGTRDGWDFKAPSITSIATLSLASLTSARTYTLPDSSGTLATAAQVALKQDILTNGNGTTISGTQVNLGGAMTSTTTFTGGNTANIDYGSFGQYFDTIRFFTASRFRVETTLGSQVLDFNGSTTTFNAGGNLALTIGGSLGASGYVLTSNGTTAAWAPATGGSGYPGPSSGTTGDMLRWDVTGTALENFTPNTDPTTTDGDIIQRSSGVLSRLASIAAGNVLITGGVGTANSFGKVTLTGHISGTLPVTNGGTGIVTVAQGDILYGSASNAISVLAKSATATRYLSNTGTTNNPAWAQVDLTNGVTGVLPLANGGTGASAFPGWLLASGGALTANNAITGAFNLTFSNAQFSRTSTYTMTANNDFGLRYTGTVTGRATASDTFRFINIDPTLVSGAATQNGTAIRIAPTFTATGGAFTNANILEAVGTVATLSIDSTGTIRSPRGISLDATATGGTNLIFFATGANASIAANGSNNTLTFTGASSTNVLNRFVFSHTYAPTSGSNNNNIVTFQNTINQVGANGTTNGIVYSLVPTAVVGAHKAFVIANTGTLNVTNTFTGISIEPSLGTGTFYGIVTNSTTLKNGLGITTPTALLHLGAGGTAASSAPIKFTSGALMSSAEAGGVEFLTDKAYLTITTGAARKEFTLNDATLSVGVIPIGTTNGRLANSLVTVDSSGTITTTSATGTHSLIFDTTSTAQAVYGLTNSGTVKSLRVNASIGIVGSTTGGDLLLNAGDGLNSGVSNGGNVILLAGAPNGGGTNGSIQLQSKVVLSNTLRLKSYIVASLPAGTAGDTAYVTDALTPAFLTIVVGGGAVVTPVFYNGTNWVAM